MEYNTVEYVRTIMRERGIPKRRMEMDLGFSNGYIGNLKKKTFPADRLLKISEYLDIPMITLLTCGQTNPQGMRAAELLEGALNWIFNHCPDDQAYIDVLIWIGMNDEEIIDEMTLTTKQ